MKKIWILVYVWHGLIEEPELFFDEISARRRKAEVLENFNQTYDEIEVFERYIS